MKLEYPMAKMMISDRMAVLCPRSFIQSSSVEQVENGFRFWINCRGPSLCFTPTWEVSVERGCWIGSPGILRMCDGDVRCIINAIDDTIISMIRKVRQHLHTYMKQFRRRYEVMVAIGG